MSSPIASDAPPIVRLEGVEVEYRSPREQIRTSNL